jgi:hypothetical protein
MEGVYLGVTPGHKDKGVMQGREGVKKISKL